jgi:hypothetical protein
MTHDQRTASDPNEPVEWQTLRELFEGRETATFRDVPISPRKPKKTPRSNRTHPPREMRTAQLAISAQTVRLRCPKYLRRKCREEITLSLVRVNEPNPPEGEKNVEWVLLTTEPVDTLEQMTAVVDIYRARWLIEEFFKALKTGCAYSQRRLESQHALQNALALSLPVAWRLLLMRALDRCEPDAPAEHAFTATQLDILRAVCHRKLPRQPTIAEAVFVMAELGGHLRSNGRPGWIVLGRAFQELLLLEAGWLARERLTRATEM